ncbi:hypothetical protein HY383_01585 [Candidatus Daviesbacteria bacterium]|nr:hypothetical protein [Candidatus Daviesbacteria bacterium]
MKVIFNWQKKSLVHFSLGLWVGISLLILSLGITLIAILALKPLPPKLPLFYSLPWGEQQLATHQQFLILPAIISILTLLNLLIFWQLHESQYFFKKILLVSSIVVSFILTVTFIKVVLNFI